MPADNGAQLATEPATGSLADRLAGATETTGTPQPPPQMPASTPAQATPADGSSMPPPDAPPPPTMPSPDSSASTSTPTGQATPPQQTPAQQTPTTQEPATTAAPDKKPDGWEVDFYQLRAFSDAVVRARSYLDAVHAKADRMQGAELDPQLGTSPVGTQLAKKFDDRLNSAHGLRAMLAEAMKRMDDFVTSAEKAARAYQENEQNAVDAFSQYNVEQATKRG